jgi:hypothetical protein
MSDNVNVCEYLQFKSDISFASKAYLSYVRAEYCNLVFGMVYIPVEVLIKMALDRSSTEYQDIIHRAFISFSNPAMSFENHKMSSTWIDRITKLILPFCSLTDFMYKHESAPTCL